MSAGIIVVNVDTRTQHDCTILSGLRAAKMQTGYTMTFARAIANPHLARQLSTRVTEQSVWAARFRRQKENRTFRIGHHERIGLQERTAIATNGGVVERFGDSTTIAIRLCDKDTPSPRSLTAYLRAEYDRTIGRDGGSSEFEEAPTASDSIADLSYANETAVGSVLVQGRCGLDRLAVHLQHECR
ncbi:MAG TPA: hypothetical protein VLL57_01650 [Candidatus Binataceae bacterium]|nr:hypothetical protein [Candidatus Binataceae bacterium]